jgi:hypothetical protein
LAIVDIIADRFHERPTLPDLPKKGPRHIRQAIGLAIAAAEQIDQDLHRQVFQRMLLRLRGRRVRGVAAETMKAITALFPLK